MQAPPSSGQSGLSLGFLPSPGYGSANKHPSSVLADDLSGLEATVHRARDSRTLPILSSNGITSFQNSYTALFGGSRGELAYAPLQEQIDNAPLVQSELDTPLPSKPLSRFEHAKVVHTPENLKRIRRLSTREQAIVLIDGGNTVESQLRVLDTIELYSLDSHNKRVWAEVPTSLPSGKETITYRCKAPGCDHQDVKFQKARQHFVSSHVTEACWGCPVDGCTHIGKYKRLDDLKHHHMVPFHSVYYTRNKNRETPRRPNKFTTAGQETSNPTNLSSPHLPNVQATPAAISIPSPPHNQGTAAFHALSRAERGPKRTRETRQRASARPSEVDRDRPGRVIITSSTISGQVQPVGAEEASSFLFSQDITSPGLAHSVQVYADALSSQGDQRSLWSNHSGSRAYAGTMPAENPYSPAGLGFTYSQTSDAPLGSPLDGTSAYPQSSAYSETPMPNVAQQEYYSHASMPHHSDPRAMTSTHRASTFSAQRDVGGPLRGQVPDSIHPPIQDRSNNQANRALDASHFGGGLSLTSPGAQSLAPSPHYSQWGQAGAGLPTNYPYNVSHHSSPITMTPTASPSGYISPSQPPLHNLGALSSDRLNGRDQMFSSMRYAPTQRATGPTHGFIETGGYLSAQTFSSPHSTGVPSPTQGTMYQDIFRRQTPQDSIALYQAQSFETQSPDFGWSPHSQYPQHTILSPSSQATASSDLYLQSSWLPTHQFFN